MNLNLFEVGIKCLSLAETQFDQLTFKSHETDNLQND
jgi:hypothetical protein